MRFRATSDITVPIIALSLLLLLVGISGAWYVHRLQLRASHVLNVNVESMLAAEELELHLRQLRSELVSYLRFGDREDLEEALALEAPVRQWFNDAKRLATTEYEQELMRKIEPELDPFLKELNRLVAEPPGPERIERLESLRRDVLTNDILVETRRYLDFNEQELERSSAENQAMANRLAMALFLLGTCGSIAGMVAGYAMARRLNRSIFQLSVPIRDVAGKLNEVVGPVVVAADPGFDDLEHVLHKLSGEVASVVEQLHARHREVLRAEQLAAVGQLAAGLAHELRNPLMCIKVLVQNAVRGGANKLEPEDLQVLDQEIRRVEQLLQSFLDFARPTKVQRTQLDVGNVMRQTLHFFSGRAERRQVTLELRAPERPVMVEADEAQIRQLLLNLLLNALDAVPNRGTIWVELAADPGADSPTSLWILRISDNGQGLPEQETTRIFEPFFSTKETGLGLGLAVCQRIVQAHGGELTAAPRPGGGASFTARFPHGSALQPSPAAVSGQPDGYLYDLHRGTRA